MHGGLGICRGFPAVSVADSQRSVSPERVPHLVVTGMATVDQVVRAPGVSSLILVTDGSGEVTFIDGRHTDTPTAAHAAPLIGRRLRARAPTARSFAAVFRGAAERWDGRVSRRRCRRQRS